MFLVAGQGSGSDEDRRRYSTPIAERGSARPAGSVRPSNLSAHVSDIRNSPDAVPSPAHTTAQAPRSPPGSLALPPLLPPDGASLPPLGQALHILPQRPAPCRHGRARDQRLPDPSRDQGEGERLHAEPGFERPSLPLSLCPQPGDRG